MTAASHLLLLTLGLGLGGVAAVRAQTPVCGDGVIDLEASEACDEGVANGTPESCCAADCTLRALAESCRPAAGPCDVAETCDGSAAVCPPDAGLPDADQDGTCDAEDVCPTTSDPGQEDGDADMRGDACDPCTNLVPTTTSKAVLRMAKLITPLGDDRFKLKVTGSGIPTVPALDLVADGIRFILSDSLGAPLLDARLPGGAYTTLAGAGWKGNGVSWTYVNGGKNLPLIQGIAKVTVRGRASQPGQYTIAVIAKNGSYPVLPAALPLSAAIVLDPPVATTGQCVEVGFTTPAGCVFGTNGTVTCK